MSEFRIEKVKHALEITLTNGEKMAGTVFLEPVARHHSGPQDPWGLLNEADAFFPFANGGRVVLIAKDHVKLATYAREPESAGAHSKIEVQVLLSDGSVVDGAVQVEARSDADRLLDYLNGFTGRFLLMIVDKNKHCLVNRRLIAGVQQR